MFDDLLHYLNKIGNLRIDRSHGKPAPHKPILLLAVIDLFEQGIITSNRIEPSPSLVEAFLKYWHLVSTKKPRIFLPFFHLKSDGFWHLHAKNRNEGLLRKMNQMNSMAHLATLVEFTSLNQDLFTLLHRTEAQEALRQKILQTYFADKIDIFRSVITDNQKINNIEKLLLKNALKVKRDLMKEIPDTPKRSIAFRRTVVRLYDYTCAACHLRLVTFNGETAVEAAHIHPFSQSYDDSIGNGLALCPLHHWLFDKGLFSIDDNYKIVVSNNFEESGDEPFLTRSLEAKQIHLPKEKPFRPSLTMIRWHRGNIFQF